MLERAAWERLRAIFDEAAPLDAAKRQALLDREFADDPSLRQRAEALLLAHDDAASILASRETESGDVSGAVDTDTTLERTPPMGSAALLGTSIGPYRLLEKLGEGGFGVVFLAEQHAPFHRRVALKLLRADANSAHVLARFDAERQALALMDHPNIATVYDAGATSSGQPYIVMELVAGAPIANYADEKKLTIDERLRLFLQLCEAIQHAHQKGVIHRDLKPSNVLVTVIDDKPQVKVIDFGVAKALGARLTDETLHTRAGMVLGTPEYMSPEQAAGGAGSVDTRSDVYSLGVILYELLTGELPLGRKGLREAALEEILRRIRTEEPAKLSTKLHSLGQAAHEVARKRQVDLGLLARRLGGDLEWITRKALEKESIRRYASPGALGEDIERSLTNRPISAHPPSAAYQLRKFAARRKGLVTFAATVFLLVLGSAIAMSTLYAKQLQEARKAERVSGFLEDMLASADPANSRGTDLRVIEVLERSSRAAHVELADEIEIRAAVFTTLAKTYLGLGDAERAVLTARAAFEDAKQSFQELDSRYIKGLQVFGEAQFFAGQQDSGLATLERVVSLERRRTKGRGASFAEILSLYAARVNIAGQLDRAAELHREALALVETDANSDELVGAEILHQSAINEQDRGNLEIAESQYRKALHARSARLGNDHPQSLLSAISLASVLRAQQKTAEAESLYRASAEIQSRVLGESHPDLGMTLNNLGRLLKANREYPEAESSYVRALRIFRESLGDDHQYTSTTLNNLGALYLASNRYEESAKCLRESLESGRRAWGRDHPRVSANLLNLAELALIRGNLTQAREYASEALEIRAKSLDAAHPDLLKSRLRWAEIECRLGNWNRAEAAAALVVQLADSSQKEGKSLRVMAQNIGGLCATKREGSSANERELQETAPRLARLGGIPIMSRIWALSETALALSRFGHEDLASRCRSQADSLQSALE